MQHVWYDLGASAIQRCGKAHYPLSGARMEIGSRWSYPFFGLFAYSGSPDCWSRHFRFRPYVLSPLE